MLAFMYTSKSGKEREFSGICECMRKVCVLVGGFTKSGHHKNLSQFFEIYLNYSILHRDHLKRQKKHYGNLFTHNSSKKGQNNKEILKTEGKYPYRN